MSSIHDEIVGGGRRVLSADELECLVSAPAPPHTLTHPPHTPPTESKGDDVGEKAADPVKLLTAPIVVEYGCVMDTLVEAYASCDNSRLFPAARVVVVALRTVPAAQYFFIQEKEMEQLMSWALDPPPRGLPSDTQIELVKMLNNALAATKEGRKEFAARGGAAKLLAAIENPAPASVMFTLVGLLARVSAMSAAIKTALSATNRTVHILVSTLAHCVRCQKPAFPKGRHRVELACEVLKAMFVLGDSFDSGTGGTAELRESMTQIGMIIGDILRLPHDIPEALQLKKRVVEVLMHSPSQYGAYLARSRAISPLCYLLISELQDAEDNHGTPPQELMPLLSVMTKLAMSDPRAKRSIELFLFPPKLGHHLPPRNPDEKDKPKKPGPEPEDAPPYTPRGWLIRHMTAREPNVRRMAGELLYSVCKDSNEFLRRVGVGRGLGLMQAKGLFSIPGT